MVRLHNDSVFGDTRSIAIPAGAAKGSVGLIRRMSTELNSAMR